MDRAPGSEHIRARSIVKRFGGAQALAGVDLDIERGTVHALVGENGAGKSTLGRILAGVHRPDEGEILVNGAGPVRLRSPVDALALGITIIAQEPTLEARRTIAENVLLGIEPGRRGLMDRRGLRERCAAIAADAGFDELAAAPGRIVATLGAADRQKVEILRALARQASLIVMDEPTAALPTTDAHHLLDVVARLRSRGITILYISHRLSEIMAVADMVTVLRDGSRVWTAPIRQVSHEAIVAAMLGRPSDTAFPPKRPAPAGSPVVLDTHGLAREPVVRGVDLRIRAGEIVGLAGLVGSGRTEIARLVFGADRPTSGTVELDGRRVAFRSPHEAIAAGVVLLPESRKAQGLLLGRSVKENVTLPHLSAFGRLGVLDPPAERRQAGEATERLDVRTPTIDAPVSSLSGGNQQKVLFARSLLRSPRLLIVDEPTRGIDVGARRAIYELIVGLAGSGMAVLLISSELDEVVGLAHRILVIREGRVAAELEHDRISEEAVLRAALAA
jgi:simple sugar transport system ATP-binding protein/ribose transport system ATP-binding protein